MLSRLVSRKIPYQLLFIFLVLVLVVSAMGYLYYEGQKRQLEKEKQDDLAAIAELKVGQIVNWRKERLGDATTIFENALLGPYILALLKDPKRADKSKILKWMMSFGDTYQYENILVLDRNGTVLLSAAQGVKDIGLDAKKILADALETGKIIISDLYRNNATNILGMDLVIPIMPETKRSPLIAGAILLKINPHDLLYHLILTRPAQSLTAETVLMRREGDNVLYINSLRNSQESPLAFGLPVRDTRLPAMTAARVSEGNFEGRDYRGMEVLASIRKIPSFSWSVITKIDKEEVFARARGRLWNAMILIALSVVSAAAGVLLIWRKQAGEAQRAYLLSLEETVKERTKELERANKKLKESYEDMESFSYSASHELREPLLIIELFVGGLLERQADRLDADAKEILSEVKGQTGRMTQLIKNLLSFSRTSTKEINKSYINMDALVQGVIEEMQANIGNRAVRFERHDLPAAWADRPMIRQVLVNLLSNAVKFTRSKETARIDIGGTEEEDENIYYVRDNGAGFAQDHAEQLFGLFSRLQSSREVEGTGVGLLIAKRIIGKHHGRIWAEGKAGEGATFFFSLPGSESFHS
jgi:signal transduction histidine kinase